MIHDRIIHRRSIRFARVAAGAGFALVLCGLSAIAVASPQPPAPRSVPAPPAPPVEHPDELPAREIPDEPEVIELEPDLPAGDPEGPTPEEVEAAISSLRPENHPGGFIRLRRDAQGNPVALETAVVRYVPESGEGDLTVALIGTIHYADRNYYDRLNVLFRRYDSLLYELVAPPGARVPDRTRKGMTLVGDALLAWAFDVESQLEHIDYSPENFVHADLSPVGMLEAMRERGESSVTLLLGIATDVLREYNKVKDGLAAPQAMSMEGMDYKQLGALLLDLQGGLELKRMLATQFESIGTEDSGLGRTLDTILIQDRNRAAMRAFGAELAKGKRSIGIYYGAAHMPDFEKRLMTDFGMRRESVRWIAAWDLRQRERTPMEILFKTLR